MEEVSDRFIVLRDGKTVGTGITSKTSPEEIVRLMVGRKVEQLYPAHARTPGQVLLEVKNLSSGRKVVSASPEVRRGEVLGIAGLVGAGRTELLRAIFGLDPVANGDVRVGMLSGPASLRKRWNQGAGFLSEDRKGEGLAPWPYHS